MDRIAIFCDGANIYHGQNRAFPGCKVDYAKMFDLIVAAGPDRRLLRVYWYMAMPVVQPAVADSQRFIAALQRIPYVEVRHKKLAPYTAADGSTRYREKGVDVWLAVDMVNMAHRNLYEVAALVSGDADLVPSVKGVKDAGRHIENYFFTGSQSLELRQEVDRSFEMTEAWLGMALTKPMVLPAPPE